MAQGTPARALGAQLYAREPFARRCSIHHVFVLVELGEVAWGGAGPSLCGRGSVLGAAEVIGEGLSWGLQGHVLFDCEMHVHQLGRDGKPACPFWVCLAFRGGHIYIVGYMYVPHVLTCWTRRDPGFRSSFTSLGSFLELSLCLSYLDRTG
jgi:hypothetical protein